MTLELVTKSDCLQTIDDCISHANRVVLEYNCENTRLATNADLRYWQSWAQANNFDVSHGFRKDHIIAFIIQHAEDMPSHVDLQLLTSGVKSKPGTHKLATIERRLASLSTFLNLSKMNNACYDTDILFLIKKLRNKHGVSCAWGQAITVDELNNLLRTCKDSLTDIRDKAVMLFGFASGGRRRSEISSASMEYLQRQSDGNYIYNLKRSKTNREGHDEFKPLFGRAAMAMTHWLQQSKIESGAIFRSVSKSGKVGSMGLCDKAVSMIIKHRCKLAGYDPTHYTAHSLRSGFVTEGGKRGKPVGDIMALTGHKSISQLMQYYQVGNIANNSTAYLAG